MDKKLAYSLVYVSTDKQGRPINYHIKNILNGNEQTYDRIKVLEFLKSGGKIKGIKTSKDNRLLYSKNIPRIKKSSDRNTKVLDIRVETGKELINRCIQEVSLYSARDIVLDMVNYIKLKARDTVCIVHGIRRTGKTVALRHLVIRLKELGIDINKIKFIEIQRDIDIADLYSVINNFEDCVIIIDEITRVKGFIDGAAYLSDTIVARHRNKVIISGTDSFAFPIASTTSLFGRTIYCNSTILTFNEYVRLFNLGKNLGLAFQNYKESGAIYDNDFTNLDATIKTIRAVVIANIKNNIRNNTDAVGRDTVYSEVINMSDSKLAYIIYCIILSATSPKYNNKFYTIIQNIGKSKKEFLSNIADISYKDLNISTQGIKSSDIQCILSILVELNIIKVVSNLASSIIGDNLIKAGYKIITDKEVCILIPSLLSTLVYDLKSSIRDGILNENIVLSHLTTLKDNFNNTLVRVGYIKYQEHSNEHEIDAVAIINNKQTFKRHLVLIEVNSDIKINTKYSQHLTDKSIDKILSDKEIRVVKIVVYFGNTIKMGDIQYINMIEFLSDTWKYLK